MGEGMKSRYCYNPSINQKIGRRLTIAERFHRWKVLREERKNVPDVFTVTGFRHPIYPTKKAL